MALLPYYGSAINGTVVKSVPLNMITSGMFYISSALLAGVLIGYALLHRYGLVKSREIYVKKLIPIALVLVIAIYIAKIILFAFGITLPF